MTTERDKNGKFQQTVDNETVLVTLTSAERPLGTSELAERVDIPRTTAYDTLVRLEQQNLVKSWSVHDTTRIWTVPGNWGETSITDHYSSDTLEYYLETGKFPANESVDDIVALIDEMITELTYNTPFDGGYRYEELQAVADLFDLSVTEFVELSHADIYDLIQEGAIDNIPQEPPRDPEQFRSTRSELEITQAAIANRAGIPQGTVSKWERGKYELSPAEEAALYKALEDELEQQTP